MMETTMLLVMRTYDDVLSRSGVLSYSDGRTLCLKSIEIAAQWLKESSNSLRVIGKCISRE